MFEGIAKFALEINESENINFFFYSNSWNLSIHGARKFHRYHRITSILKTSNLYRKIMEPMEQ